MPAYKLARNVPFAQKIRPIRARGPQPQRLLLPMCHANVNVSGPADALSGHPAEGTGPIRDSPGGSRARNRPARPRTSGESMPCPAETGSGPGGAPRNPRTHSRGSPLPKPANAVAGNREGAPICRTSGRARRRAGSMFGRPGEDVGTKSDQPVLAGIPQMAAEPEQIFQTLEQRVMIVGHGRDRPRLDEGRDQHGTDPVAAEAEGDVVVVPEARGLRKAAEIGAGLLVAATGSGEGDDRPAAGLGRTAAGIAFIEGDDEQSVELERRSGQDDRNPLLEEAVGRAEASLVAIGAGLVMAVMAQIGCDEAEGGRGGDSRDVDRQLFQPDDRTVALRRVDYRMEIDEGVVPRRVLIARRDGVGGGFRPLGQVGTPDRR